ncbi:guanine nucleotide exchange factor SPIKE 1-like [Phalaenopsis equestris]|uniref:guanine nucleotide exchange factor SPIKE 1-like n=1 Tax=Phalaenopsis equestris TaxID=78828 RepID=UPI0009E26F3D|nr:guanine nucleotide exchange factor SPIKE 1-like [Phalaenopsis equestris]
MVSPVWLLSSSALHRKLLTLTLELLPPGWPCFFSSPPTNLYLNLPFTTEARGYPFLSIRLHREASHSPASSRPLETQAPALSPLLRTPLRTEASPLPFGSPLLCIETTARQRLPLQTLASSVPKTSPHSRSPSSASCSLATESSLLSTNSARTENPSLLPCAIETLARLLRIQSVNRTLSAIRVELARRQRRDCNPIDSCEGALLGLFGGSQGADFRTVSLYMDKFAGICQSALHDCKLTFLQIICDHDLFVEMPGKDPSDRNYLASLLIQEAFLTLDHEDLLERAKAARILVFLMCKHEFDLRYQKCEDRLYIAQLYFPLIGQILDEMPVFYNLNVVEKREVLIVFMQIIRNLDDASLVKAWQQGIARTRLFFKLLEECLTLFDHRREGDCLLVTSSSRSPDSEGPLIPKYSDLLSPAINTYLSEASRQELKPQGTPENGYMWHRVSPQISSPSQPYSLREALAQAQSSRIGASTRALRESLHPLLRQKLELWEENLSAAVSLLVLELAEKFSNAAASHAIATDYAKLDCITSILTSFFSRSQPLSFWKAFFPVFNNVFNLHGATLMARENDRFLKQVAFHLLRLSVFRNDSIRRRAVIGLQILIRNSFYHFGHTTRLRVMLTITLSELMSEVQVTRMRSDGSLEETGEARFLRKSLEEMADEGRSAELVRGCGLPPNALEAIHKGSADNRWTWLEVKYLSDCLILALDAGIEHALLVIHKTLHSA